MCLYLLKLPDGEPHGSASFESAVPNEAIGETLTFASGDQLRILAIETEIADELIKRGFNGVLVVEPA